MGKPGKPPPGITALKSGWFGREVASASELDKKLKAAVAEVDAMTDEQREAMWKAQRASWARQDMD